MLKQFRNGRDPKFAADKWVSLPQPTFLVNSGTGFHLYYVLDQPIPLIPRIVPFVQEIKAMLTDYIWRDTVSTLEDVQHQGIYQPFRMPGTPTKLNGKAARVENQGQVRGRGVRPQRRGRETLAMQPRLPARIRRRPRRQGPRRAHRAHAHRRADPHRARQEALARVVPGAASSRARPPAAGPASATCTTGGSARSRRRPPTTTATGASTSWPPMPGSAASRTTSSRPTLSRSCRHSRA